MNSNKTTDFGFRKVPEDEKARKVAGSSVLWLQLV